MAKEKILVAMSGGVDSSVAAGILLEQGYEPIGVTMRLWDDPTVKSGCCALDDVNDAQRVADRLEIPHYVVNLREQFKKNVVDYFIDEYMKGRTPNPCIACNRVLKFDVLLKRAKQLGASKIATGHYARITRNGDGYTLRRGVDENKDQSYFLFETPAKTLGSILFPLGEMTKEQTRAKAEKLKLKTADKAESQEVCFAPDGDYFAFIKSHAPSVNPGKIKTRNGKTIGEHKGIPFYTVGQRKRLNLGGNEGRLYVTAIEPETNSIVVGPEEELYARHMIVKNITLNAQIEDGLEVDVQVRYRQSPVKASVHFADDGASAKVLFNEPERAVAPGQAAVFYIGDRVAGGGWIDSAPVRGDF